MPRVIAIMNQKGGVGKTTTTLNLGAALAQRGKRVLLVDLDPQANLTLGLGKRAADLSQSVYELLTNPKAEALSLLVETQWERLHLVPSHIDLSGAEIEMVTMIGRETRLSKALHSAHERYDYILIDCLPSLSLLTVNAMAAAGEVFVPLQAHPFALEGLGKLFEVVGMIREAMNPGLKVSGVLVTMFDGRTNVSKVTLESLRQDQRLKEHIFTTTVKQNIKVAESQKDGVPVIYFDPSCHAAKAYQALCTEVLEMESGCLASVCAANIMLREAGQKQQTFTPDLMAPQNTPQSNAQTPAPSDDQRSGDSEAPAESSETPAHSSPVSALMNVAPKEPESESSALREAPQPPPAPALPQAEMPAESSAQVPTAPAAGDPPQTAAVAVRNTPDVESLHPSCGVVLPASGGDLSELAQAALTGVVPSRLAALDYADEDYRPRLVLKPGTLNIGPS